MRLDWTHASLSPSGGEMRDNHLSIAPFYGQGLGAVGERR